MLKDTEEPKRPLAADQYWAPAPSDIWLEDGCLFWEPPWPGSLYGEEPKPLRRITPTVETFTQFLNLAETDNDGIVLRYAKRWGVLNLCKRHLEPVSHSSGCIPVVRYGVHQGEPVSEWRRLSRVAGAILHLSEDLYKGKLGHSEDWEMLKNDRTFGWQMDHEKPPRGIDVRYEGRRRTKLAERKTTITEVINRWLEIGNVRPTLRWISTEPNLVLAGRGNVAGLFAALGVQLLENSGSYVIVACTGCRRFFDASPNPEQEEGRKRRPKTGQGRYCRDCLAANIPVVMAKRRQILGMSKPRKPRKDRRK